ncbi:MAG TPA: DUF4410 domain-containing protein [Chthoniobacteraceae bacterium]|jgi:hypothetical protein|nr:DUF4410 domain-containing protein [Chthoniobacteraceae bacterium]
MKNSLLALCSALLLTSCAGVRVVHTDVATGATDPKAIYIRPFDVSDCTFIGRNHSPAERPIRKSLAPAEFSETLKEELEKIAPAMVLKPGDVPGTGWLVEGSLDLVNAGDPAIRAIPGNLFGAGASHIRIHVRIIDLSRRHVRVAGAKETATAQTSAAYSPEGPVIYEFDVAGGSRLTGKFGSVTAPGLGYAPMFDYQNASERIYEALAVDEFRYGEHDGPTIR